MAGMRLRQRSTRALAEDWVQPRWSGRWTTIGNLDSPWRGAVDPAGLVTLVGRPWSLDWWIGAEDRWHLPSREVAVRQSLLGGSPVVETRLRVPGGDAVHRAYAARSQSGAEAIVVEVENRSRLPFALALALRPYDQTSLGRIGSIALDGTTVTIDGEVALVLPRSPGRIALSDASADSADTVLTGGAEPVRPAAVSCEQGLAQAALVFPLAHTAVFRAVIPVSLRADAARPTPAAAFPDADRVASGWGTVASTGVRMDVPSRPLRDAVTASTRHLLLGRPDLASPAVAAALDLMGFSDEAGRRLRVRPSELARTTEPGAALHALARHWELTHDPEFARDVVDLIGALVPRLARAEQAGDRALGARALGATAALLEAADETRAADDVCAVADRLGPPAPDDGEHVQTQLADLLPQVSGTWTWGAGRDGHDLALNAALVTLARRLLVREDDAGLALAPVVPEAWLGQGWELHDAPTRHGKLSYAVRWHGERPALLWQLEALGEAAGASGAAVTISIPGLDGTWSTTEPRGEALLGPVALPEEKPSRGVTTAVSIAPMPGRRA
jgi:hypothetical protein